MGKYVSDKCSREILTDDELSPSKVAILENGYLVEYLCLLGPEVPQIGSIHIARVHQVFRQHRLATAEIENGLKISVRLSNEKIKSGELVIVTIGTEPWGRKPARATLGAQIAGKYVILLPGRPDIGRISKWSTFNNTTSNSLMEGLKKLIPNDYGLILRRRAIFEEKRLIEDEIDILLDDFQKNAAYPTKLELMTDPKKIFSGLSLIKTACIMSPGAIIRIIQNTSDWHFVNAQVDTACDPKFTTKKNVVIWFQSTEALTAIDIDSAASKMSPSELSLHVSEVIMSQVRLRQISGIVVIDMPRLSKIEREKFQESCKEYALSDIRHPDIYGIGPAGLLEMTVRHRYMPLSQRMKIISSLT